MLRRSKMSTVDTAWLRMDSDGNLMVIVGVAMLRDPISAEQLKQALRERFLVHSRFRSVVEQDLAGAWWQEVDVDLDEHVVTARAANKAALQTLVGLLSAQPLDRAKPLWQMHLVDVGAGQALVLRIHHCIADGIALVGVFMSMFGAAAPLPVAPEPVAGHPWEQWLLPVPMASLKAIELSSTMFLRSLSMPMQLGEISAAASQLAVDAIKLSTMDEDTPTSLKGKPNGKKHVAWSDALPLDEVKAVAKAFACSVNDALMSSVAGALRAYLAAKGEQIADDCGVRVMVPVNLRKPSQQHSLGNAFGLVPLVLPLGIEDPIARMFEVRARMNELKGSYTALVAMSVLGVLGATPKQVQTEIQNYFARKATAVMSNVPGPQTPLYLAGSQLEQCMFWVPQSGDIGIGVSILSYNGGVQFGIVTDDAMVKDPDGIISRFAPEFEKLLLLALMSEWQ